MATKQGAVIEQPKLQAESEIVTIPATREPQGMGMSVFERMASDPTVDVGKLEKLMELHERALARTAQEQFNIAMASAQADMRPVAADASNPQTRSRYASYAALDKALRPIYSKYGLALSFNSGDAPADHLRLLCDVTHIGGHCKTYRIDVPNDGKGAKGGDVMTKTHAQGAAASYGMRYLLKMIFNVAVGEDDRDGNTEPERPKAPEGFVRWLTDFEATADNGMDALEATWKETLKAKPEFCAYLNRYGADKKKAIQAKAAAVKA
jgi:hypothetical protein